MCKNFKIIFKDTNPYISQTQKAPGCEQKSSQIRPACPACLTVRATSARAREKCPTGPCSVVVQSTNNISSVGLESEKTPSIVCCGQIFLHLC